MKFTFSLGLALILVLPTANAYVGPGLGAGTIGAVLGIIGAIFIAIFGIAYYPIKRWLKKRKKEEVPDEEQKDKRQEADV